MAPVIFQAPMSAADKYKAYVRSNSKPSHQFDDNMKEPNNNTPDFKDININNIDNSLNNTNNFNDDAQHFFTCYTSYSCTPTDIPSVQTNQNIRESTEKPVQADQENILIGVDPNNNQLNNVENGKQGQSLQLNNVKNTQLTYQTHQINHMESSCHPNTMSQMEQNNKLKNTECGKPAPHAELINVKNTPSIPSPLIMMNDATHKHLPRQRTTSGPTENNKPKRQYGLAHSHSSPSISSKGSSPTQNESLVLHYFQNPHTYKNLQERQLPGQGPVPKSMLPPPAPPAAKRKATSSRNSSNEKRNSLPNAKSGEGNSNDWEKVLTKFYQW